MVLSFIKPGSNKWEKKHKQHSLSTDYLANRFLTMSNKDFDKFVSEVSEARSSMKSKKEAVEFGKELTKDVLIPLLINSAKK